jgi:hypothetical protein
MAGRIVTLGNCRGYRARNAANILNHRASAFERDAEAFTSLGSVNRPGFALKGAFPKAICARLDAAVEVLRGTIDEAGGA